ncbi:MAG: rod shape-determining protein MreD [Synechococcaceae cyanobacterium]|nr:rod shape-determining protein MreD [Synechococcaceae cyanobacterium]
MAVLARQPVALATALLVPWLTLAAPGWLQLGGVAPAWTVLWLLPWSLADGRFSGVALGLALGLLLDGLHPGAVTLAPGLMLLGWWWGRLGRRSATIERSFSLGLLALVGTAFLNLTLMAQWAMLAWWAPRQLPLLPFRSSSAVRAGLDLGVDAARLALPGWDWDDLQGAGLSVLLAQTMITALLAPMLCSLQLLLWRQLGGTGRR